MATLLDCQEKLPDNQERLLSHLQQLENDISKTALQLEFIFADVTTMQQHHIVLKAQMEFLHRCKTFQPKQ